MRVSLVVLTKDNSEEFTDTLSSLYSQSHCLDVDPAFTLEVVVVDSSVDPQSCDFLERLKKSSINIAHLRDFPPQGIYPAMNLGLAATTGDLILFLNSGDAFFDVTSLSRLLQCCLDFRVCNGFYPTAVFGQAFICPTPCSSCDPWLVPDPAVHSIRRWLSIYYPNHQSLLVSGSWARAHPFRPEAPQSADRVWMRDALSNPLHVAYLAEPVVRFSLGGVSSGLPDWTTLMVRLREPTRTWFEKFFEFVKFMLRPWARYYPKLMALRSRFIGRLV